MISIIIPVYNKSNYIKDTLMSVLSQSITDIEVIVIDDGSTDNSLNIVEKIRENDHRIKLYVNPHKGVSFARNTGLKNASGEYITFIDADDTVAPDYLEQLLKYSKNDLVVSGLIEDNKSTNQKKIINAARREISFGQFGRFIFNHDNFPIFSMAVTKLYSSKIIKDNQLKFRKSQFGEDTLFVMDYIVHCKNIRVIGYAGYINQILDQTLSRKYLENIWDIVVTIPNEANRLFNLKFNKGWQYLYVRSIKLSLLNNRNRPDVFKNGCKKIAQDPSFSYLKLVKAKNISDSILVCLIKFKLYSLLLRLYKSMY